jgi:hypothetical protein
MLYILVLLYVFNGQLVLEKPGFESMSSCVARGNSRIEELQKDPRFDGGLFAQCVELPGQKS